MLAKTIQSGVTAVLLGMSSLSAAAGEQTNSPIEHAQLVGTMTLDGELFHVQGLVLDGPHIWVTSVDRVGKRGYLHEVDRATGRFLRRLELTDGERFHPGGMSMSGRSLWVPVAELRPDSSAVLVEIDADTLQVRRRIPVADHLGCVAASGNILVAGNWDSRLLYVFDLGGNAPVRTVPNPSQTRFQDMKFVGNALVAGGPLNWWSGSVDWLDWPSMRTIRSLHAGAYGPDGAVARMGAYTAEGLAIEGRDLYLLPEDGPSRVFHFHLDDTVAGRSPVRAAMSTAVRSKRQSI